MKLRLDRPLLIVSAACAVAAPGWLLRGEHHPAPRPREALVQSAPVGLVAAEDVAWSAVRPIFPGTGTVEPLTALAQAPDGAGAPTREPNLVGIVGRLPDDAVALVRADDGRTRSLRRGQSFDGWRLASLAGDAALFIRGGERIRVSIGPDS